MVDQRTKITREELYGMVWTRPFVRLASEIGYTYSELVKLCADLNIPRPSGGHWYRLARGHAESQTPLPSATPETPMEIPYGSRRGKGETPLTGAAPESDATDVVAEETNEHEGDKPAPSPVATIAVTFNLKGKRIAMEPPQAAERAVLDMLRQAPRIDFWREAITEKLCPYELKRWLELDKDSRATEASLVRAVKHVRKEYRCFQVEVGESRENHYQTEPRLCIKVVLRDGFEWKDAWEEAWSLAEQPNPHCLSDNGTRLYIWAKGPKNKGQMTDRNKIGAQAGLRGTYSGIEDHLHEIRLKADPTIQWAFESQGWQSKIRVWFEKQDLIYYHHGPMNPTLGINVQENRHAESERFKNWLHEEILKPGFPEETETVGVIDISDRKTLEFVFKDLPDDCGTYGPIPDFFGDMRMIDGMELRYEFEKGEGPWLVVCNPIKGITWHEIKARLIAKFREIPLEKKYNLSPDSRALLKWILELRNDEYLLRMTPTIEGRLDDEIGIVSECGKENVKAYLELLVEEINEKTEFNLRTISWRKYSEVETRILVKTKESDMDGVIRAVQTLGLKHNKLLDVVKIRTEISRLMEGC